MSLTLEKAINITEKIFVIASLIFFTGAFILLVINEHIGGEVYNQNESITSLLFFSIYLILFLFIIIKKDILLNIIKLLRKEIWLLLIIILMFLSIFWSIDSYEALRKVLQGTGLIIFGIYFGLRFNLKEQLDLLSIACGIILLSSIIFSLYIPELGLSSDVKGAWQGVFDQKNILGKIITLSFFVFLFNSFNNKGLIKLGLIILYLISFIIIVLSQSKTALIVFILTNISCLIYLSIKNMKKIKRKLFICLFFAIFIAIFFIFWINQDTALNILKKDNTLTGRTTIWALSFEKINEKPLLGYGYGSFWRGRENPSKEIAYELDWAPPNAHNGFIDILLDLGIVGFLLFIYGITKIGILSWNYSKKTDKRKVDWPFAFIVLIILYNLTEETLIRENSVCIFLVLFTSIVANLTKEKS